MQVKIGNVIYDSNTQPIMIILSDKDKENIKNMHPKGHSYCSYPDWIKPENIVKWMKQRIVKL